VRAGLATSLRGLLIAIVTVALAACSQPARKETDQPAAATVLFGGDLHFAESYEFTKGGRPKDGPHTFQGRYRDSLSGLMPLVASADFTIANLEGPLSLEHENNPLIATRQYLHWSRPREAGEAIKYAGIDLVGLSNNHGMDQGVAGLEQTFAELDKDGVAYFGGGKDLDTARKPYLYRFKRGDGSQAVLAVFPGFSESEPPADGFDPYAKPDQPGIAPVDPAYLRQTIPQLRKQYPDLFVVAYPHWGHNYSWVYGDEIKLGRELVDAGADMVIGHHAHTIQEIERYRGKWIVYGIGNFIFLAPGRYKEFLKAQPYAFAAELAFPATRGSPPRVRLFPIAADNRVTNFQARLLDLRETRRVISAIQSREGSRGLAGTFGETSLGAYFQLAPTE
jgi:hypothetical protein